MNEYRSILSYILAFGCAKQKRHRVVSIFFFKESMGNRDWVILIT